jgi:hypothetical protein
VAPHEDVGVDVLEDPDSAQIDDALSPDSQQPDAIVGFSCQTSTPTQIVQNDIHSMTPRAAMGGELDGSGTLHYLFINATTNVLRHGQRKAGVWSVTDAVTTSDKMQSGLDLAVDGAGKLHVSYGTYSGSGYDQHCASGSTSSWTTSYVGLGGGGTIVADAQGKRHLAYFGAVNADIRYATDTTGSWAESVVATGLIATPFIARASSGQLYIAYASNGILTLATESGTSWTTTQVSTSVDDAEATPLEVDSTGALHLTFLYEKNAVVSYVRHGTFSGGSWSFVDVDPSVTFVNHLAMALDHKDKVHVVYTDTSSLYYATNAFGGWGATALAAAQGAVSPTITVDPGTSNAQIGYFRWDTGGYHLYHLEVQGCAHSP